MRKIIGSSVVSVGLLALPTLAGAQTLFNTLGLVSQFLNAAIAIFVTLAILIFFWGLIKYLMGEGAEGKAEGLKIMLMGVITIFVMVSIWGIIRLLQNTFKVGGGPAMTPSTITITPTI